MSSEKALRDDPRRVLAFTFLGALQVVVYFSLAAGAGQRGWEGTAMALALVAFAIYVVALAAARPLSGALALGIAVGFGLIFRALLFPEAPFLSDDHFRYLWDGVVQLRGINPYRYAPADAALAGVDEALRGQVNHPNVSTIYPPAAQIAFVIIAATGTGLIGLKALWLGCDVVIATLLYHMVDRRRRLQLLTLYWWSPLVIIEVIWNAHLDLLGVLLVVAALWLATRSRPHSVWLGIVLAVAAAIKYFPAALVPAAADRGRRLRTTLAFVLGLAVLYLPYATAGADLFAGLQTYAEAWRFNDGAFAILAWATRSVTAAKLLAGAAVAAVVASSVRNDWSLERTAFWVTGAILLLSPTVHPWYLLWMVPLIALRPNQAWLYLSGSVFLAYYGLTAYRAEGVWPDPLWIKGLIWGPFLVALAIDSWRGSWWSAAWQSIRAYKLPDSSRS